MSKIFHLVTDNEEHNKVVEIDFTEYEILQIINLCYRRRYNKTIGIKFGKIYIESKGKNGRINLENLEIDVNELEQGYSEMKRILGDIH